MNVVGVVLRWLHIVPAVAAGGATLFALIALLPALDGMPEPSRRELREKVAAKWRVPFIVCTTLLLLSGLANFILFQAPAHRGQPVYHALFGVKFLLSLALFALAIVLTSTRNWSARWRESRGAWLALTLITLAVVLLGGVMKVMPPA